MRLHEMTVEECVGLMNCEDRAAADAVDRARPAIRAFITHVEAGFLRAGRLIYVGAGTSGRLGVLDASEAPPTFCVDAGKIVGIIAGGDSALRRSSEGLEDVPDGSHAALRELSLTSDDAVLAISAGGTTPFALGALAWCKSLAQPPVTALLRCSAGREEPHADHVITLDTGPEVLTGSTRLKAGTATKMTLNIISTALMIRAGKAFENLMVDVRATNDKLRDRAARIISTLTALDRAGAFALLNAAGGTVKVAIVMHRRSLARMHAERLLAECAGRLGDALAMPLSAQ